MPPKGKKPKFVPLTEDWGTLDETDTTGTGLDMSFSLTLAPAVEAVTQGRPTVTPPMRRGGQPQRQRYPGSYSGGHSGAVRQPPVAAGRPHDESYVLPTQAPFIAKIINAAYSVTEDDLMRALSSLPVKDIKPFGHKGGNFLVEFQDVQGLKQCLDKYWGFEIKGRPIKTFVAEPRNSATDASNWRGATEPSAIGGMFEQEPNERRQHRGPPQRGFRGDRDSFRNERGERDSHREDRPQRDSKPPGFDPNVLSAWRGSTVPSSIEIEVKPEQERRPQRVPRRRSPHKEDTVPKEERAPREPTVPDKIDNWRGSTVASSLDMTMTSRKDVVIKKSRVDVSDFDTIRASEPQLEEELLRGDTSLFPKQRKNDHRSKPRRDSDPRLEMKREKSQHRRNSRKEEVQTSDQWRSEERIQDKKPRREGQHQSKPRRDKPHHKNSFREAKHHDKPQTEEVRQRQAPPQREETPQAPPANQANMFALLSSEMA
ncbi:hypothetical protein GEMRC1_007310 [Eukaryota sp. GEM-RC1]